MIEKPCETCLKAEASRLGPTDDHRRTVPKDDGLIFIDIHHVTTPAFITGHRVTLGSVHNQTSFRKTAVNQGPRARALTPSLNT